MSLTNITQPVSNYMTEVLETRQGHSRDLSKGRTYDFTAGAFDKYYLRQRMRNVLKFF